MSEWDRRQLCPDGGCVGVIGPDGRCKVCGRVAPNWGDERKRGLNEPATDDDDDDDDDRQPGAAVDAIAPSAPVALGTAGEWAKRQLCGDGSCIGVIGAGGRCKVCGRTLAESQAGAPPSSAPDPDEVEDDDDDALADDESEDVLDEDEAHDDDDDDVHDDDDEDAELAAAAAELAAVAVADAEDELATRSLCPDGACVGVIGSDGRCKVCGKEAA